MTTVFRGTPVEGVELVQAVNRNCRCRGVVKPCCGADAALPETCGGHQMLNDQRAIDGLLFARKIAERLRHEEFTTTSN